MLTGNYEQILRLISENSGLALEEIERKIEAKKAKLSGLISKEGAAQIIASELGINFERQKLKIAELLSGMKKITIMGKIIKMNRVVEYNKNGRSGKIGSFLLADDTSNVRVVLWDTNHITLIEDGTVKEGDFIELSGGDVRNSEVHLTGFADMKLSSKTLDNLQTKAVVHKKALSEMNVNDNVSARAFIVQIFGPTFYSVCPECGKRVFEANECAVHGAIIPKKNSILTLIVDDGTANMRAVLFSENIKKVTNGQEFDSVESFSEKRKELLGKEIILEGNIRKSKLSDSLEIFANDIQEINLDSLIEELESVKKKF